MRVLCIGDSLTSGMTISKDFPYSSFLSRSFSQHTFDNAGVGGDEAVSYPPRLSRTLKEAAAKYRGAYDAVIIWGGTNDVRLQSSSLKEIAGALQACIDISFEEGVEHVVVLTIMEMECETAGGGGIMKRREALNEEIRRFKTMNSHRVVIVDVAQEIQYHTLDSDGERQTLWCDGLHLTRKGYSMVAEKITAECNFLGKKRERKKKKT